MQTTQPRLPAHRLTLLVCRWLPAVLLILSSLGMPIPSVAQTDSCIVMPGGIRFCPPPRVPELTQCVRNMERFPNRTAAEACRRELVASCRTLSDDQFSRQYAVQRPRLIDARAGERTTGWNTFCPISLGYRYTPVGRSIGSGPVTKPIDRPDQSRMDAIREAGGDRFLVEPFDASAIVSLPDAGPCRCNDGTDPVFGFCTGPRGAYKPACAK